MSLLMRALRPYPYVICRILVGLNLAPKFIALMVILRIWPPSPVHGTSIGFASLEVSGTYMSVRPLKPETLLTRRSQNATLADDVKGEAVDTPPTWVFTRLNEARMMRTWEQFKGDVATDWNGDAVARNNCFRFSDMVLAAGRGVAVDSISGESLTARAEAALALATLSTDHAGLSGRAEHYLKVEHW